MSEGEAFDRGIQCILKCQIRVNGKLTVWCAQHDEINFRPRPARSFELASLSGSESVGIVRLLMSIERPSAEVTAAVEAAVAWFESAKLESLRVVEQDDAKSPSEKNKVVVKDPTAIPLWARFYEIESNRPFFADRDGVAKYELSEIGNERRNGYVWYGNWPQKSIASTRRRRWPDDPSFSREAQPSEEDIEYGISDFGFAGADFRKSEIRNPNSEIASLGTEVTSYSFPQTKPTALRLPSESPRARGPCTGLRGSPKSSCGIRNACRAAK
jgi:hypothetical protein